MRGAVQQYLNPGLAAYPNFVAAEAVRSDVFDIHSSAGWTYSATASTVLKTTTLALTLGEPGAVKFAQGRDIKPKHSAGYWAKVTAGFDFSDADRVPPVRYNRVLWQELMGRKPYPVSLQVQTAERIDD